jgi:hypothetical protein
MLLTKPCIAALRARQREWEEEAAAEEEKLRVRQREREEKAAAEGEKLRVRQREREVKAAAERAKLRRSRVLRGGTLQTLLTPLQTLLTLLVKRSKLRNATHTSRCCNRRVHY